MVPLIERGKVLEVRVFEYGMDLELKGSDRIYQIGVKKDDPKKLVMLVRVKVSRSEYGLAVKELDLDELGVENIIELFGMILKNPELAFMKITGKREKISRVVVVPGTE